MKITIAEQIAAVEARALTADPRLVPAMNAAAVTLKDYQAMQPKVLALSAAALTLAGRCGMKEKEFDELMVELEKHAEIQIEAAKKAEAEVLLVEGVEPPAWPFRRERMP